MKKITKLCNSREDEFIFTEGINYFETGKNSIWGNGDKDTLNILDDVSLNGKWLNLACGDGRYNNNLLEKVDSLMVSDIDESALSKLWCSTSEEFRNKLLIKCFDITKKFPLKNNYFDGIFCTGTLHLFPERILKNIFIETNRILKPGGRIMLDFATDIKRITQKGDLIIRGFEPCYKLHEAELLLKDFFVDYSIKFYKSEVIEDNLEKENMPYKFSCKFIVMIADKK